MNEKELPSQTAEQLGFPPALANRATRRACTHRMKGGYCVDCGTPETTSPEEN